MNSYARALRFVLAQQGGLKQRDQHTLRSRFTDLQTGKRRFHAEIVTPAAPEKNPIVFLHGMSPLGISDPRQVRAVRALAHCGFRVICPELPDIRNLRISARSIDDFSGILTTILRDKELVPEGRLALFAPSFSGAIILRAAAQQHLTGQIAAVCAMGSLAGIRASMEFLFLSSEADTYARYIVLANYLPLEKKYAALAPVIMQMAHDNWNASAAANPALNGFERTNHAAQLMRRLRAADRRLVEAIVSDPAVREKIFTELSPRMQGEIEAYDVMSVAPQIEAPVFLLHGADDNVIPPKESELLSRELKKSRLLLSPFVGHGDSRVTLGRIPDVFRLLSGFAWFFRHALL